MTKIIENYMKTFAIQKEIRQRYHKNELWLIHFLHKFKFCCVSSSWQSKKLRYEIIESSSTFLGNFFEDIHVKTDKKTQYFYYRPWFNIQDLLMVTITMSRSSILKMVIFIILFHDKFHIYLDWHKSICHFYQNKNKMLPAQY